MDKDEERKIKKEPEETHLDLVIVETRKLIKGNNGGSPIWLISFTDVIALMLTFFVLLFSMSVPIEDKWQSKIGITASNIAEFTGPTGMAGAEEGTNINRERYHRAENLDYLLTILQEILQQYEDTDGINVRRLPDDLLLSVTKDISFNSDGTLSPQTQVILRRLAEALNRVNNQIVVSGQLQKGGSTATFVRMQNIAETMKDARYKRPIGISLTQDQHPDANAIHIYIRWHDGRRITG